MSRLIRDYDWGSTPLGPIEAWPQILRSFVGMLVENQFPMYIFWGDENIAIYNDGYIPIAGAKHPAMLGKPTEQGWSEIWDDVIAPMLARVKSGEAVTVDDLEVTLQRYGFPEQFYCSFCYSPLRDESGEIVAVLATVTDTTQRVLANRRLETLRQLASRSTAALTEADALVRIREALEGNADLPFGGIYLTEEGAHTLRLASRIGSIPAGKELPEFLQPESCVRDGIVAVPIGLEDHGRYVGALLAGTNPHLPFDQPYREFVNLVASQIGNSISAARAFAEERLRAESRQVIQTVEKIGLFGDSGQQLFWMARADGAVEWYHRSWYEYTGQTPEDARGWGWQAVHHPDDLPDVMVRWPESVQRGVQFEMTFRLRGKDGRYRWFLTRAVPEHDDAGHIARWYGTCTNVDTQRRAVQQINALASLGERLVQTPDRQGTLRALADGLVPDFADWTLINLADAKGVLKIAATHHRDPEVAEGLRSFVGTVYAPEGNTAAIQALETGKPVLIAMTDASIAQGRVSQHFAAAIESMGIESIVIVPIVANGDILGTFHAVSAHAERIYSEHDVPFFEEIGRRIGYALQNADAYEREWRIAHAFQSAALPAVLPTVPGLHFSSLYEPARHEAQVGGDFYDAFRLLDGRVVVSIGDVAGTGIGAAATMAQLRQSIRAVASVNPDPEMLLKAADGVFSEASRAPFASAFVAVIDPLTFSIQYANAGHPAPVLRRPDGSLEMLGDNDLLLGISVGSHYGARHVGRVLAEPGSLLVLYTDGLSEALRDPIDGEFRLMNAVRGMNATAQTARVTARAIWETVMGGSPAHDDVAVMAVFLETPLLALEQQSIYRWRFASSDGAAAHAVRNEMEAELQALGMKADDIFAAQMIYSELVSNVFRHAGSMLDVVLDLSQDAPVLHVLDTGEGYSLNPKLPADAYSERGRGVYIVTCLAREFTVTPRTLSHGSHARAVLRGRTLRRHRAVELLFGDNDVQERAPVAL